MSTMTIMTRAKRVLEPTSSFVRPQFEPALPVSHPQSFYNLSEGFLSWLYSRADDEWTANQEEI